MIPFKRPMSRLVVTFDADHPYHGAEVALRLRVSVPESLDLFNPDVEMKSGQEAIHRAKWLGDHVIDEWNLVDENDQPVPVSGDAFIEEDPGFVFQIVRQWTEAYIARTRVSDPLETPSNNTPGSEPEPLTLKRARR